MTEDSLHIGRIVGHRPINEPSFLISNNGTCISEGLKKKVLHVITSSL